MMTVNILIVEDETLTSKVLSEFLQTYNRIKFVVSQASTLQNAIDQIEHNGSLDIIILDLNLGRSSWHEVLPQIEKTLIAVELRKIKNPEQLSLEELEAIEVIPVIAMTGHPSISDEEVFRFKIKALIRKPFSLSPFFEKAVLFGTCHALKRDDELDNERIIKAEEILNMFYNQSVLKELPK